MAPPTLVDWNNFYLIIGSTAGGLIGLTFVVISLAAENQRASEAGLRTFVTPTIVHFGGVLSLAAFLSAPHQTPASISIGLGLGGLAGVMYLVTVVRSMRRLKVLYVPVREDWIWNAGIPTLAYAVLLVAATVCRHYLQLGLYGAAFSALILLFTGVHNAWDVAVWNSTHRQGGRKLER